MTLLATARPGLAAMAPAWYLAGPAPAEERGAAGVDVGETIVLPGTTKAAAATRGGATSIEAGTLVVGAWAAGVLLSLCALGAGLIRLRGISAAADIVTGAWANEARVLSRAMGLSTPVTFRDTDRPALLVAWGARHAQVLLPSGAMSWPAERVRLVAAHELAHVQRADWAVQMLAELLRSVFWFNPLAWLVCRRLRQESECACDDAVLALGMRTWLSTVTPFRRSASD